MSILGEKFYLLYHPINFQTLSGAGFLEPLCAVMSANFRVSNLTFTKHHSTENDSTHINSHAPPPLSSRLSELRHVNPSLPLTSTR